MKQNVIFPLLVLNIDYSNKRNQATSAVQVVCPISIAQLKNSYTTVILEQ